MRSPDELEPLLSIDEVAEICQVPRRTVERWLYEKTPGLVSLRLGRHRRFTRAAVMAFLESRTDVGGSPVRRR